MFLAFFLWENNPHPQKHASNQSKLQLIVLIISRVQIPHLTQALAIITESYNNYHKNIFKFIFLIFALLSVNKNEREVLRTGSLIGQSGNLDVSQRWRK